jgi:hypothetical protein
MRVPKQCEGNTANDAQPVMFNNTPHGVVRCMTSDRAVGR